MQFASRLVVDQEDHDKEFISIGEAHKFHHVEMPCSPRYL
jgi:hypothetical protein